jgi:hypothetical protein
MSRTAICRPRHLFDKQEPPTVLSPSQKNQMLQLIQAMLMDVFAATIIEEATFDEDNA